MPDRVSPATWRTWLAGGLPAPRTELTINDAGRGRCEAGWSTGTQWWERLRDFDLWLVWAGRGTMELTGGRKVPLRPGTGFWMRPGRRYVGHHDPRRRLGIAYVHFDLTCDGVRVPDAALPDELLAWPDLTFVDATFHQIVRRYTENTAASRAVAASLLRGLLHDYVQSAADGHAAAVPHDPRTRLIADVATRIREEPGRPWSAAELAREASYSEDHFRTIFRDVTGLSLQRFIIRERVERARHLLDDSDLNVTQVAAALGYRDVFYFSRQFRQVAGVSPKAWRTRDREAG